MKGQLLDGFLDYFHDGIFKDSWKSKYFKFFDDGILEMFDDKKDNDVELRVNLRDVCNFVCVGHFTKNVPAKPKLPEHSNPALLLCFPKDEKRDPDEIVWVMFTSMDQLNDWMKVFISTFPGGKRSESRERDREEKYERNRRERSRERNRPDSSRRDRPLGGARGLPAPNVPGYDPTVVANNTPRNPGGSIDNIAGWSFNNNLPTGVNFGFGMGWPSTPGYNQNFIQPPMIVVNNINNIQNTSNVNNSNNVINNNYQQAPKPSPRPSSSQSIKSNNGKRSPKQSPRPSSRQSIKSNNGKRSPKQSPRPSSRQSIKSHHSNHDDNECNEEHSEHHSDHGNGNDDSKEHNKEHSDHEDEGNKDSGRKGRGNRSRD